jgi:ATP-dependent protease ClpP protease subunit
MRGLLNYNKMFVVVILVLLSFISKTDTVFGERNVTVIDERNVSKDISANTENAQIVPIARENNSKHRFVIRFIGDVNDENVNRLLNTIDQVMKHGTSTEITILISSTGGNTASGLAAYNYIKSLPKTITIKTHNVSALSIAGILLYCAGVERSASSVSMFIIQQGYIGVNSNKVTASYLRETYEWNDSYNETFSQVVALSTNNNVSDVAKIVLNGKTFNPKDAKNWGLVHTIKDHTFDGTEIIGTAFTK